MDETIWLWIGFVAFVLVALVIDLAVFHRRAHVASIREAAVWYGVWVALALLFAGGVFLWSGHEKGTEFLTGYVIELSLSADNTFVFLIIFSSYGVSSQNYHRVLFYGILGALFMRGAMIAAGVTLLDAFQWVIYPFGAFLVLTGIRMFFRKEKPVVVERHPVVRFARRFFPMSEDYDGQRFITRIDGKLVATPLLLVLLVVETTDLAFAVDSVPAVLSITTDPFIVFTSNILAVLGLRALFFLLAGVIRKVRHLKTGLTVVLVFVGVKMLLNDSYEIPTVASLAAILGILGTTVLISYIVQRNEASEDPSLKPAGFDHTP